MNISKELLIEMLQKIIRIRLFEQLLLRATHKGKTRGPLHLCIGEEAIAVGVCSALRDTDYVTSTHRGHGHCIAKGGDLNRMMAELMGKETGYCKGRGGSMHLADTELGLLSCSGIVAGGIPVAVGAAFSANYRQSDQVAVSFFGDGATNQGAFHEALNLASVWKLPVVFVCENNLYGISHPSSEHLSVSDVAQRAAAYNMPGDVVDGMDVQAVYAAADQAIKRARRGEGPSLIECKTYRYQGHAIGDPTVYRTKNEVDLWKQKDPLELFKTKLSQQGILSLPELERIECQEQQRIEAAMAFANDSPSPDPESHSAYTYA